MGGHGLRRRLGGGVEGVVPLFLFELVLSFIPLTFVASSGISILDVQQLFACVIA
ncbi:MAG: hypothetical protein QXR33_07400 [Candidatus Nezhaarchaeales archaeon]